MIEKDKAKKEQPEYLTAEEMHALRGEQLEIKLSETYTVRGKLIPSTFPEIDGWSFIFEREGGYAEILRIQSKEYEARVVDFPWKGPNETLVLDCPRLSRNSDGSYKINGTCGTHYQPSAESIAEFNQSELNLR